MYKDNTCWHCKQDLEGKGPIHKDYVSGIIVDFCDYCWQRRIVSYAFLLTKKPDNSSHDRDIDLGYFYVSSLQNDIEELSDHCSPDYGKIWKEYNSCKMAICNYETREISHESFEKITLHRDTANWRKEIYELWQDNLKWEISVYVKLSSYSKEKVVVARVRQSANKTVVFPPSMEKLVSKELKEDDEWFRD